MTELFALSAPRSPAAHLVETGEGGYLFLPNGSRLYQVDGATYAQLDQLSRGGDEDQLGELLGSRFATVSTSSG
jgi:hypothetical protein